MLLTLTCAKNNKLRVSLAALSNTVTNNHIKM